MDIERHDFAYKSRSFKSDRSVGPYVSRDGDFKMRDNIRVLNEEVMEPLFIKIIRPQGKSITIGIIYRLTNQSVDGFVTNFNEILVKVSRENKICYIMGDFNLNLLNHQTLNASEEFSRSATFIDNILTNYFEHHH